MQAKYTLKYLQHFYNGKYIHVNGEYNDKSRCWEFVIHDISDTPKENYETVKQIAARFVSK